MINSGFHKYIKYNKSDIHCPVCGSSNVSHSPEVCYLSVLEDSPWVERTRRWLLIPSFCDDCGHTMLFNFDRVKNLCVSHSKEEIIRMELSQLYIDVSSDMSEEQIRHSLYYIINCLISYQIDDFMEDYKRFETNLYSLGKTVWKMTEEDIHKDCLNLFSAINEIVSPYGFSFEYLNDNLIGFAKV